ncbi:Crp/Fnr family transcriptional regulator [Flavobacterium hercynium]|uniref:Cyclic nucleotide-binding protein n=1 Tax=Flavobacterium hercynium TaxID=387094 RepID=A0A226HHK9_9FLAO|nr:Crp/Fnr family transcriptional regulator [Flavobacterium hercynium]OXA93753.1 cyclic nucleotide-binding protein [Flavobacterium hercynium]SMP20660.1 cAMP-binding domain of CRP or a regulatory subunit of cAMP-dependent protein kinases [Flavobacterium hercynium]
MDITATSVDKESPLNQLIRFFNGYFALDEKECKEVVRLFSQRNIRRRGYVLQEGDTCRHYFFIVSGCFKMFAVDPSGKEHNLQFASENEWISDLHSFYSQEPSRMYIEAIEPSIILQIQHDDLLYLFIHYHKFDRNFRIITEHKYINFQNRILQNISSTAEERYISFTKQYPELLNRIPNTQIASYLGITPEFLSKIRKNIVIEH